MRFVVMGAGGFAKEVTDLIDLLGHDVMACYQEGDSSPAAGHILDRVPVVPSLDEVDFEVAAIAVGNPIVRERFMRLIAEDSAWPTLIHPSASISPDAVIGTGSVIMQNAVVSADAVVGRGTLVNVGVYVAHDCQIGAFTHLAPGTQLGGGCHIGSLCELGLGTIVLPNVHVAERVRTGAGAVVASDLEPNCTAVGVPARRVETY